MINCEARTLCGVGCMSPDSHDYSSPFAPFCLSCWFQPYFPLSCSHSVFIFFPDSLSLLPPFLYPLLTFELGISLFHQAGSSYCINAMSSVLPIGVGLLCSKVIFHSQLSWDLLGSKNLKDSAYFCPEKKLSALLPFIINFCFIFLHFPKVHRPCHLMVPTAKGGLCYHIFG